VSRSAGKFAIIFFVGEQEFARVQRSPTHSLRE